MTRKSDNAFLQISDGQVKDALTMPVAIDRMKEAFMVISSGQAEVPLRSSIDIPQYDARALFMPVFVPALQIIAVKVVSVYPHNASVLGIPNIHGKLLLIDGSDGVPLCLMDAEHLTAMRTGAASGLATHLLANTEADTLAVFGTGVQAFTQVQGVLAVRNIRKVLVFGLQQEDAVHFATLLRQAFDVEANAAERYELKKADIICTATNARTPVFSPEEVKPGCHINAIGSFKPDMQELPSNSILHSRLFVDQREACLAEAGDIVIPVKQNLISPVHIAGELGELIDGRVGGRMNEKEITVFKSVGNAVQDAYAAHWVWKRYLQ